MITVSVFFDFSKAFDRVSYDLLLAKLSRMNFSSSTLRWLHSYLHGRLQAVRDLSGLQCTSPFIELRSGVPQGSILGPLLFSLFMTDFSSCLRYCKYGFYADEPALFSS